MILQALAKYYENLAEEEKVPKPGWCSAKVSYQIDLSEEGDVKGIISLKTEEERGKKTVQVPQVLLVPEMVTRSSGVSANFLCDNAKYLLGISQETDEKNKKRVKECFDAARERHLSILSQIKSTMAKAVCLFFEKWNPEEAMEHPEIRENWEEITDGSNLIFGMGMDYAQDDADVKKAWDIHNSGESKDVQGICLVTGERAEIARIHRGIKGVPGAQSSGAALVSFNAPAFESYGKEQSYNAPVGMYGEFAYTTALNYLLSDRTYSLQIGDTMVVFWAESAEIDYQAVFMGCMDSPTDNQEELKSLFKRIQLGQPIIYQGNELDPEQRFYVLGLAPNAARLSVRFFYENSFGNILKNAIAYGDAGSEITVQAAKGVENVVVTFVNRGAEIPKHQLEHIFEKFYRSDSARSTDTGNAGLGLAIAKEIVTLHGGEIWAVSNKEDTKFIVKLPILCHCDFGSEDV